MNDNIKTRNGIISAGNWLVDFLKIIEVYPSPGNLVTIESVEKGLGGCAHNVLVDLARMRARVSALRWRLRGKRRERKVHIESSQGTWD